MAIGRRGAESRTRDSWDAPFVVGERILDKVRTMRRERSYQGRQNADDLRLEPGNGRGWMPSMQSRSENARSAMVLAGFGRISSPFRPTRLESWAVRRSGATAVRGLGWAWVTWAWVR